jgi:hypothetical protein
MVHYSAVSEATPLSDKYNSFALSHILFTAAAQPANCCASSRLVSFRTQCIVALDCSDGSERNSLGGKAAAQHLRNRVRLPALHRWQATA